MSTDILISFDSTGSMYPCINEVRRRVRETVSRLFKDIPDLRIALIVHGDYCDEPRAYFQQDFTDDEDKLIRFIQSAPNTYGGDYAEFYEYVFQRAQKLDWQADRKVYIFIADAVPHYVGYRYNGRQYNIDWKKEVQTLADMGVSIYSVEALGDRNSSDFYEPLAHMTNGRKVSLNQFADAVETIVAISYHTLGTKLEDYQVQLSSDNRLNKNLRDVFRELGSNIGLKEVLSYKKDLSGLIPVAPHRFQVLHVDANTNIKEFVSFTGATFKIGKGFYQFTKPELVQEMKEVVLVNKETGDMFTGAEAREFIGLPFGERGKVKPQVFEKYDVYIQSTSPNRKLIGGTKFLYENDHR